MASRLIEDLTPRMQKKIRRFEVCLEVAVPGAFRRSCTFRSQAEQNALWKRGRNPLSVVNEAYRAAGRPPITEQENKFKVTWTTNSVHTDREAVDYFIQIISFTISFITKLFHFILPPRPYFLFI